MNKPTTPPLPLPAFSSRALAKVRHAAEMRGHRTKTGARADRDPSRAQYEAFTRAFDAFNAALFAGKCPPCMLTFSRKKGARGFYKSAAWEVRGGVSEQRLPEISLNPSGEHATLEGVASTLVHEMCHAYQDAHGTPSRSGYHNHEWAFLMESVGLTPTSTGEPGGKIVGQSMTHLVDPKGRFAEVYAALGDDSFLPFREAPPPGSGGDGDGDGDGKPSKAKRVYLCPTCAAKIWGKPGLRIACMGQPQSDAGHEAAPMIDEIEEADAAAAAAGDEGEDEGEDEGAAEGIRYPVPSRGWSFR